MNFKSFDRLDWSTYGGAEMVDGVEPLRVSELVTLDGVEADVVIDANGVCVYTEDSWWSLSLPTQFCGYTLMKGVDVSMGVQLLVALGFEEN